MDALTLLGGYMWLERLLYWLIALAGLIGAVTTATTRDDAYPAAGRQGKWIWVAILAASTFVVFTRFPFLSWAGIVAIGVYYFDVRPQIKSIISGNYGW